MSNLLTSLPATDFRTLFESGPGLYLALTPDLSIIAVSEGYLQTTRSRREDLLGRKVLEVFANQGANAGAVSADALQASLARVLQTGRPDAMPVQKCETARPESEGGGSVEKFLRPTNSPILGADREVLYIIHRLEDATELEALAYSISHDLRAPLRSIHGFSRILENDCGESLGEEGRKLLEIVRTEAQRMDQLMEGILSFSRLGRQAMQYSVLDLGALAKEVFRELLQGEPQRNVRLQVAPLPEAQGDAALMRQVFSILLSNAIKFTRPRTAGAIEIGAQPGMQLHTYFVRDNGVGFDNTSASRLFRLFQRLHAAHEFEGAGVGLALAQRIIQRHGGQVWAESKLEQSATFYFTLPNIQQTR